MSYLVPTGIVSCGVSRNNKTTRRRSFKATSANRAIRFPVVPVAISDIVLIEHGAIIMPIVLNDQLEHAAPISLY